MKRKIYYLLRLNKAGRYILEKRIIMVEYIFIGILIAIGIYIAPIVITFTFGIVFIVLALIGEAFNKMFRRK